MRTLFIVLIFFLSAIQLSAAELHRSHDLPNEIWIKIIELLIVKDNLPNLKILRESISQKINNNYRDIIEFYDVLKTIAPVAQVNKSIYQLSKVVWKKYRKAAKKAITKEGSTQVFGELLDRVNIDKGCFEWFYRRYKKRIGNINAAIWAMPAVEKRYEETYITGAIKIYYSCSAIDRILNRLLKIGAKADLPNKKGEMPIDLLWAYDFKWDGLRILKDKGGDPNNYYEIIDCPGLNTTFNQRQPYLAKYQSEEIQKRTNVYE